MPVRCDQNCARELGCTNAGDLYPGFECDDEVRLDAGYLVTNAEISKDRSQGCIPGWAHRRPAGPDTISQGLGARHTGHVQAKSDHDPPDSTLRAFDAQRGGLL